MCKLKQRVYIQSEKVDKEGEKVMVVDGLGSGGGGEILLLFPHTHNLRPFVLKGKKVGYI